MKKQFVILAMCAIVLLTSACVAAQKGMGNTSGVARGVLSPIITLSGTIVEIHVGPCVDATMGNDPIGIHLFVQTSGGTEVNLHLGPARVIDRIVAPMSPGQTISFDAFSTPDLAPNAYIAKTLFWQNEVIKLRDDALRPFWAK